MVSSTGTRVAIFAVLAALSMPTAAHAHLRSGTVAVDYRTNVTMPRRWSNPAFTARVYQSDQALELAVKKGHSVLVLGYLGEPLLRLDGAGLAVNTASPTAAGVGLLKKVQRSVGTKPSWLLQRGRASVVWHDARVQGLPATVSRGEWNVPVIVDARRAQLGGEIWRVQRPSLWRWLLFAGLCLAATVLVSLRRRREVLRAGSIACGLVAAAASALTAVGFALDTYASPGSWIAGADELVFIAVGLGVLARGPRQAHVGAAIGLGLLALAIGLSKGPVFMHAIVLSALSNTEARLAVAVAIASGTAASILGGVFYASAPTSQLQWPPIGNGSRIRK